MPDVTTNVSTNGPVDIADVVRSYQPDGDVASHRLALELLESDTPAWPRTMFEPGHFTASGFVGSPDGESMLLIHHAKLDRWLQPGGHFEPIDDTIEAAARREVEEETGVGDLLHLGFSLVRIDAHPIPARDPEPGHTHFDLGVGFRAGSFRIGPIDEVLEARWVRFDDLTNYDADNAVLGAALRLRELLSTQ